MSNISILFCLTFLNEWQKWWNDDNWVKIDRFDVDDDHESKSSKIETIRYLNIYSSSYITSFKYDDASMILIS